MGAILRIQLDHPVRSARWAQPDWQAPSDAASPMTVPDPAALDIEQRLADVSRQQQHLAQTCRVLDDLTSKMSRFYEEMITTHRQEIAHLAVEIARKVLAQKVRQGDYDIEAILQEAIEKAPAKQAVTVHVSPQDWEACQRLQQQRPDSPWACLAFVADPSMGQAQCLVETSRGVVKSFIEDQLTKIEQALGKAE
jgi:flagellar biosynthesis/type III secretory pathway protein FliH